MVRGSGRIVRRGVYSQVARHPTRGYAFAGQFKPGGRRGQQLEAYYKSKEFLKYRKSLEQAGFAVTERGKVISYKGRKLIMEGDKVVGYVGGPPGQGMSVAFKEPVSLQKLPAAIERAEYIPPPKEQTYERYGRFGEKLDPGQPGLLTKREEQKKAWEYQFGRQVREIPIGPGISPRLVPYVGGEPVPLSSGEALFMKWERTKSRIEKAEQKIAARTTQPIFEFVKSKTGVTERDIGQFFTPSTKEEELYPQFITSKQTQALRGFGTGLVLGPIKYPATTAVSFGIGAFARPAFAGVGAAGRWGLRVTKGEKVVSKFPTVSKVVSGAGSGIFKVGVGGAYIGTKGMEIMAAPTPYEKGFVVGKSVSTEMGPIGLGAATELKYGPKLVGWWRTRGLTRQAPEMIMEPPILRGERTFPTGPPKRHLKEFISTKYKLEGKPGAWHAAPEQFAKDTKTLVGTSELPGMYVAPSLSPHFLKVKPAKFSFYGGQVLGQYGRPTALFITPTKIAKAPKIPRGRLFEWFMRKAERGKAYVPGIKTEKEAIIPPETPLTRTAARYYTEWKGVKVPIYEYKTLTGKPIKGTKITAKGLDKLSSSYRPPQVSYTPLVSVSRTSSYYKRPSRISSLVSYKPSKVSYAKISRVSYPRISRVSYPRVSGISYPKISGSGISRGKYFKFTIGIGGPPPPIKRLFYKPKQEYTKKRKKLFVIKKKREPKYKPSLVAIGMDIKTRGKVSPVTTGLPIRPVKI